MKSIVKLSVNNPEQFNFARMFRLLNQKFVNGELVFWMEFDSTDDAKSHLNQLAREFFWSESDWPNVNEHIYQNGLCFNGIFARILNPDESQMFKSIINQ
jgi:hypothetical protein